MDVRVEKTSPSERVLTVTVAADQVEDAYNRAFQERRKTLRLKGFRKGNVPNKIAKKHITDAHLVRRVVNILVPPAYKEALKVSGLQPLGKPEWKLEQSARGSALVFEATVHVMPLLEIDGYQRLKVERRAVKIDSERVEQIVYRRRQGVARYFDRPAGHSTVMGDFCVIDYQASHKGVPLPHAEVSNFLLEMQEDKFLPGFVDKLVGASSGQQLEFPLRLPENYAHQSLAGEEVIFQVKVHQIKERQVPELNDDFARTHCNADSLQDVYTRVRRNLEHQGKAQLENDIVNELVSRLASNIDLDIVPPQLQEGHAKLALRTQTQTLERQGLTLEQWLSGRNVSMEHFSEELNLTGLVEARLEILYRSLANAENIVVTNREVDQAILNQAKSTGNSAKELKVRMLEDNTYKLLAYRLLIQKIRKRLLELADVTYTSEADGSVPKTPSKKTTAVKKKKSASKKTTAAKKKKSASKKTTAAKKKKSASKKTSAAKKKKSASKKRTAAKKKKNTPKKTTAAKKKKNAPKRKSSTKAKKKQKSKAKSKKKTKTSRKKST